MDVRGVLADVSRLGAFATVATGPLPAAGVPVAELYAGGRVLAERIAHVRRVLGCDERVAASISYQGFAAMLVSPVFAAAVVHGVLPLLGPSALRWVPGDWTQHRPDPDAVPVPDPDAAADALVPALLDAHLAPLLAAVRAQVPVSERVLRGNAASALAATKRLVVGQWPATAERAAHVAARLLDAELLAGAGQRLPPRGPDRVWTFRRRSCCLYWRVQPGGLCGDCVLLRLPNNDSDG